jgi:hypothetical protein
VRIHTYPLDELHTVMRRISRWRQAGSRLKELEIQIKRGAVLLRFAMSIEAAYPHSAISTTYDIRRLDEKSQDQNQLRN